LTNGYNLPGQHDGLPATDPDRSAVDMEDTLYAEFYDPTQDFTEESRAFCYVLATELIEKAKRGGAEDWYEDTHTKQGVLLLLFTWNFAARKTKKLSFDIIGGLLKETKADLRLLAPFTIMDADDNVWARVKRVFEEFARVCGQTGASKALSLLNPHLFVMWDTAIRKRLDRLLIRGIKNGQTGEQYVAFLKGVQGIIKRYGIVAKLPVGAVVAKKLDEYNYVRIVMKKKPV
jgi:hypothetical protein